MSRAFSARIPGRLALPVCTGIGVAYSLRCRRAPIYFDTHHTPNTSPVPRVQSCFYRGLTPEAMRQLSSGSISGLGVGLLVSFLSHTLVLLSGLAMFTFYLAHRYGLDLPQLLGLKERLNKATLGKPFHNAVFRLSFAATFTLAAFVRF